MNNNFFDIEQLINRPYFKSMGNISFPISNFAEYGLSYPNKISINAIAIAFFYNMASYHIRNLLLEDNLILTFVKSAPIIYENQIYSGESKPYTYNDIFVNVNNLPTQNYKLGITLEIQFPKQTFNLTDTKDLQVIAYDNTAITINGQLLGIIQSDTNLLIFAKILTHFLNNTNYKDLSVIKLQNKPYKLNELGQQLFLNNYLIIFYVNTTHIVGVDLDNV